MRTATLTLFAVALLLGGCTTTQQQKAYQTLGSVVYSVDGARKAYADAINLGQISVEQQKKVDGLIADYQLGMNTALDVAQNNLLTLAPDEVALLASRVVTTIIILTTPSS